MYIAPEMAAAAPDIIFISETGVRVLLSGKQKAFLDHYRSPAVFRSHWALALMGS